VVYLPQVCELRTGKAIYRRDPLTQAMLPFVPIGGGGCGRSSACPNLLMRRYGSLGFIDLRQRSGIYHYPNMRASCWLNMVPACGLVLVPEGSSSCPCAYNYKTSIAFMSATRHNHWGLFGYLHRRDKNARLRALRLNFGAPGDKPAENGDIWYAFPRPSTGGPRGAGGMGIVRKDRLPVEMIGTPTGLHRVGHNPDWTRISKTGMPWLYTYALTGPLQLKIRLAPAGSKPEPYRVVLHFCDLEGKLPRPGRFTVKLQDQPVFLDLDVHREAGGANCALLKEVTVSIADTLTLEIEPQEGGSAIISGLQITSDTPP